MPSHSVHRLSTGTQISTSSSKGRVVNSQAKPTGQNPPSSHRIAQWSPSTVLMQKFRSSLQLVSWHGSHNAVSSG